MNWVHLALILVFLFATWAGYHRGFILGSLDLLSWAGSFVAAYMLYDHTKGLLEKFFDLNVWLLPASFLVTLVIARILLGLIIRAITRSLPEQTNYYFLNKFLGILPGAINGWIAAIVIAALLSAFPFKDSINSETRDSKWATQLAMQSEWINTKLAPVFDKAVRHTMNSLTVHPKSNEKVPLGFTYENAKVRPFLEIKMLEIVNEERVKNGLEPLQADPELTLVARAHSNDMFVKGYFAHESPDGKSPFDRMRQANVQFAFAGENLALAQTLAIAHTNLMNSPGAPCKYFTPIFWPPWHWNR